MLHEYLTGCSHGLLGPLCCFVCYLLISFFHLWFFLLLISDLVTPDATLSFHVAFKPKDSYILKKMLALP